MSFLFTFPRYYLLIVNHIGTYISCSAHYLIDSLIGIWLVLYHLRPGGGGVNMIIFLGVEDATSVEIRQIIGD